MSEVIERKPKTPYFQKEAGSPKESIVIFKGVLKQNEKPFLSSVLANIFNIRGIPNSGIVLLTQLNDEDDDEIDLYQAIADIAETKQVQAEQLRQERLKESPTADTFRFELRSA